MGVARDRCCGAQSLAGNRFSPGRPARSNWGARGRCGLRHEQPPADRCEGKYEVSRRCRWPQSRSRSPCCSVPRRRRRLRRRFRRRRRFLRHFGLRDHAAALVRSAGRPLLDHRLLRAPGAAHFPRAFLHDGADDGRRRLPLPAAEFRGFLEERGGDRAFRVQLLFLEILRLFRAERAAAPAAAHVVAGGRGAILHLHADRDVPGLSLCQGAMAAGLPAGRAAVLRAERRRDVDRADREFLPAADPRLGTAARRAAGADAAAGAGAKRLGRRDRSRGPRAHSLRGADLHRGDAVSGCQRAGALPRRCDDHLVGDVRTGR